MKCEAWEQHPDRLKGGSVSWSASFFHFWESEERKTPSSVALYLVAFVMIYSLDSVGAFTNGGHGNLFKASVNLELSLWGTCLRDWCWRFEARRVECAAGGSSLYIWWGAWDKGVIEY
jgi:hypothetical protein